MDLIKDIWTCKECGAWNAAYRTECGKCLEMKEKKVRQYRSRQGRSDSQYESSAKVLGFTALILFGALFIASIIELVKTIL
jgi:ribosomal protein L40E